MKTRSLGKKTNKRIENSNQSNEKYGCTFYFITVIITFTIFNLVCFIIDFDKFKGSFYGIESASYFILDDDILPPHKLAKKTPNKRFFKDGSNFGYVNLNTGKKRFFNTLTHSWVDKLPKSNPVSGKANLPNIELKGNKIKTLKQNSAVKTAQSKKPKKGDRRRVVCPTCDGRKIIKCDRCIGKGIIWGNNRYGDYGEIYCPKCSGEGRKKCGRCAGEGKITEEYSETYGWFLCMKCEVDQMLRNMPIKGGS